jgi:hypothetical protein
MPEASHSVIDIPGIPGAGCVRTDTQDPRTMDTSPDKPPPTPTPSNTRACAIRAASPRRGNLGATRLPMRRRATDAMRAYDALPRDLRLWLAGAARPWSPRSCLRLWRRFMAEEKCPVRARARLDRAEAARLARDAGP